MMNSNVRMDFRQISKAIDMHFNTVSYDFSKLPKLGYIKRFTPVRKPMGDVNLVAIYGRYSLAENLEADTSRVRRVFNGDKEMNAFIRYSPIAQLTEAYDFSDVDVFDSLGVGKKKFVSAYKELLKKHLA